MTIKKEVQEIMDDLFGEIDILSRNTRYRRFFRSWLNGSYHTVPSTHLDEFRARRRSELREIVFDGVQFVPPLPRAGFTTHEGMVVTANEIAADDEGGKYAPHGSSDWMDRVRWLRHTSRLLRAWVIDEFVHFVAYETGGALGTVQRYIVASVTDEDLARLTGQFIDEALGLISYGMTDDPSEAELEAFTSLRDDIGETYASKYLPEQYYDALLEEA